MLLNLDGVSENASNINSRQIKVTFENNFQKKNFIWFNSNDLGFWSTVGKLTTDKEKDKLWWLKVTVLDLALRLSHKWYVNQKDKKKKCP